MDKADAIRDWLLLVEQARVAVNVARSPFTNPDELGGYDLGRAEDYLTNAYDEGLTAYGKAFAERTLAASSTASVA